MRKTIMREVKILKALSHVNIVGIRETFRRKGKLFIVFEYMDKNILEARQRICMEQPALAGRSHAILQTAARRGARLGRAAQGGRSALRLPAVPRPPALPQPGNHAPGYQAREPAGQGGSCRSARVLPRGPRHRPADPCCGRWHVAQALRLWLCEADPTGPRPLGQAGQAAGHDGLRQHPVVQGARASHRPPQVTPPQELSPGDRSPSPALAATRLRTC